MGAPLSPRERREVLALAADLDVLRPGEAAMSPRVHDALEAIGIEFPHSYSLRESGGTLLTCDVTGKNFDVAALARAYAGQHGEIEKIVGYDPRLVQPEQRNRALLTSQLRVGHSLKRAFTVWRTAITGAADQLRMLACDGPAMLAWVGGYGRRGFDARDRARLQLLSGALQRRLVRERRLRDAGLSNAALDVALEALPGAAFILDAKLRVAHRNRVAGDVPDLHELELTPIEAPGLPRHWLARPRAAAPPVTERLARRYGLTPRETKVLALVAQGHTNRAVAVAFACSERTVEVHLTRILAKTDAESRAELVARAWRET